MTPFEQQLERAAEEYVRDNSYFPDVDVSAHPDIQPFRAGARWLLKSELIAQVEDAISSLPTLQAGQFQHDSPLGRLREALTALKAAREGGTV